MTNLTHAAIAAAQELRTAILWELGVDEAVYNARGLPVSR
jgi:hypothetical protein